MLLEELALELGRLNYKSLATQFSLRHFPLGVDEKQLDVWIEKPLEKLTMVNNTFPKPSRGRFLVILVLASLSPPQSPFSDTQPHPVLLNISPSFSTALTTTENYLMYFVIISLPTKY